MPHGQVDRLIRKKLAPRRQPLHHRLPLSHLPYGAFTSEGQQHLCVAIGTHLLDLHACATSGLLHPSLTEACQSPTLNLLMSQGPKSWTLLRKTLTTLLLAGAKPGQKEKAEAALHSIAGSTLHKPVHIPNYTDFYASIHHAIPRRPTLSP